MNCYEKIEFYEASTLISFIKDNTDRIISNRLLGIYTVSNEMWYGSHIYTTSRPLIFEFENFAVQVEYYVHSKLKLTIVDRDSFLEGELTRCILGYQEMLKNPQPFRKAEISNLVETERIQGIEIGRFNEEHTVDASSVAVRPSGGDYF